jgi:hypothetical protein
MELKVKNPYTTQLAYRWYIATVATIQEMFEDIDKLRDHIEQENNCTTLFKKRLNEEISAHYHLCDDELIKIEYIIELFGRREISHSILIFHEAIEEFQRVQGFQKDETVRSAIEKYCSQIYYVCKCGELAKPRLGMLIPNPPPHCIEHRCETCFLYWFKRTDDRCAVCLEDEGVWVKLSCGHILHQHCWGDIQGMVCPVCRTMTDSQKNIQYYPFLSTNFTKCRLIQ